MMFFLSWRQLIARKKQSILILLGISLGTLLYVAISGLQLGTRNFISDSLLNNTAHVLISGAERMIDADEVTGVFFPKSRFVRWVLAPFGKREESRLENYNGWYQMLSQDSEVLGFSPRLTTNVILSYRGFTTSVALTGTIPERQRKITSIDKYITEGSFSALSSGSNSIVIGSKVAEDIGARLGQYIQVSSGHGVQYPFKVVGIAHFGNDQVDGSIAFGELGHVQVLAQSPGRVNEIAVALFNIEDATIKASEWKAIGRDKVQDWQEANKIFMEMIAVQDYARYFITSTILLVAAFGIYNVLTIMINQKKREIAILRALGYGPQRILELILYQGLLLGIVGGILGLIFGYLTCVIIGSIDLGIEIGGSSHLTISYDWKIYVTALTVSIAAAVVASYLPARAASKMTPMDIIRTET
ncbi:MAG: FtsX-like permease family protein [Bdellovibrionota bacterium]